MSKQIATTKEQSARLIACGVSSDTANMIMSITNVGSDKVEYIEVCNLIGEYKSNGMNEVVPAWSLSELLELLPKEFEHNGKVYCRHIENHPDIFDEDAYMWEIRYAHYSEEIVYVDDKEFIEACVKTIELLTRNGYILTNTDQIKVKRKWDGKVVAVTEMPDGKYKDCDMARTYDKEELDFDCQYTKYCEVGETICNDHADSFGCLCYSAAKYPVKNIRADFGKPGVFEKALEFFESVDKRPKNIQLPNRYVVKTDFFYEKPINERNEMPEPDPPFHDCLE